MLNKHIGIIRQFGLSPVQNTEGQPWAPDLEQDVSKGFEPGSKWSANDGRYFECIDATKGAAEWRQLEKQPDEFADDTKVTLDTQLPPGAQETKSVSVVQVTSANADALIAARDADLPKADLTQSPSDAAPTPLADAGAEDTAKTGDTFAAGQVQGTAEEGSEASTSEAKIDA